MDMTGGNTTKPNKRLHRAMTINNDAVLAYPSTESVSSLSRYSGQAQANPPGSPDSYRDRDTQLLIA